MKILLLFLIFSEWNDLIYCKSYNSNTTGELGRSIVLAIGDEKARTYVHEGGYIEWKIDRRINLIYANKTNVLLYGEFHLSNSFGRAILLISPSIIIHYVYINIDGQEFKFNIEYARKDIYGERRKKGANKRIYSWENPPGGGNYPRRHTLAQLLL